MKEKILIIEDDFTIQTQLKTLLYGNGYEVFAVTDFSQTIEQLKEAAPHLVILDIKLPGNNGFEICSGIRTFSYSDCICNKQQYRYGRTKQHYAGWRCVYHKAL
jgi:DNA-binding response OmpR family regulator